jgi:hypothetical protein
MTTMPCRQGFLRNLSTRTSMYVGTHQKHLAKSQISTLNRVNLICIKEQFVSGLQDLSSLHKIDGDELNKILPFSNMILLVYLSTHISTEFSAIEALRFL